MSLFLLSCASPFLLCLFKLLTVPGFEASKRPKIFVMLIKQSFMCFLIFFTHIIFCQENSLPPEVSAKSEERIEETEDADLLKVEEHNYTYYWHQYHQRSFWIDIKDIRGSISNVLRESYLYGHPIVLHDYFIFYGHRIKEVLVTTGGFLYMDEMTHRQLTYSQYIAPLMANFETKSTNDTQSTIKFFTNSTILIVWWTNMKLRHIRKGERFTFQLVYYSNGSIFFNYKKIPAETFKHLKEGESHHKIAVGLSDAYYLFEDSGGRAMRVRVVFEYHQLSIPVDEITKCKTIEIKTLPNCVEQKTCERCTTAKIISKLDCQWCPSAGLCSDGFDRMRQKWLEHDCAGSGFVSAGSCKALTMLNSTEVKNEKNQTRAKQQLNVSEEVEEEDEEDEKMMALRDEIKFSGMLLVSGMVVFVAMWLLYAIKYPNSSSGRWLIEHRPTKLMERLRKATAKRWSRRTPTDTYVSFDREMNTDVVL